MSSMAGTMQDIVAGKECQGQVCVSCVTLDVGQTLNDVSPRIKKKIPSVSYSAWVRKPTDPGTTLVIIQPLCWNSLDNLLEKLWFLIPVLIDTTWYSITQGYTANWCASTDLLLRSVLWLARLNCFYCKLGTVLLHKGYTFTELINVNIPRLGK